MFKYTFVFICSFSLFISEEVFYPMKKDNKLGEHICRYTENLEDHNSKTYVKPCEEGKFCVSSSIQMEGMINSKNYHVCKNFTNQFQIKINGEQCTSDFECDTGLTCKSGQCTNEVCNSNQKPYKTNSGSWSCKNNDLPNQNFYYYCYNFVSATTSTCSSPYYSDLPDYLKLRGIITFEDYYPGGDTTKGKHYRVKSRESSYIGSVEDGKFVKDYKACKSGFALHFYPDGSLKDPSTDTSIPNKMYLMCVTLKSYDSNNDIYIYNINGDEDKIYNANQRGPSREDSIPTLDAENYLIDIELFKKYTEAFNNNLEECQKTENYNNPDTCNVDEVTKWYYFYDNHLDYYLFYYADEEKYRDVIRYLIQKDYHFYQSSRFLNIKYLISLLFLLLI